MACLIKSKTRYFLIMTIYNIIFFHIRLREYAILSDAFKLQRLCENEMFCFCFDSGLTSR